MNRLTTFALLALAGIASAAQYDDLVAHDHPIEAWTASPALTQPLLVGGARIVAGPRPPEYPMFGATNHGVGFAQPGASLRIRDEEGRFAFKLGDTIAIEAWVNCDALGNGQNVYLIGKGRTGRAGQPPHNQNWGLRLRENEGNACPSFVFRDERDATTSRDEFWHRWTASTGFLPGAGWHHVAVSYTFGKPETIHGWLDGAEVKGAWDMGGATALGPWADHDEVWIGTSQGGAASASLRGALDGIAIYRTALTDEGVQARWQGSKKVVAKKSETLPPATLAELPKDKVRLEIFEHRVAETEGGNEEWTMNDSDAAKKTPSIDVSWSDLPTVKTDSWTEPAFALAEIVPKYSPRGVRRDRTSPFLIRLAGAVTLPAGPHQLLIRAIRGARLSIDGKVVATSAFYPKAAGPERASDAEAVADQLEVQLVKEVALLPPGHSEAAATFTSDNRPHVFVFEAFVGGKNLRSELGQPSVSISTNGSPYRLLTADAQWLDFSDDGWKNFTREQRAHDAEIAATRRANAGELAYWKSRHDLARAEIAKKPPIVIPATTTAPTDPIDAFIDAKLEQTGTPASAPIDDAAFLRRVTLDTIGLVPTPAELTAFLADASADKRARAIDRLLADQGWADQWIPYWQDVLAENPAILKATLNNTGPFRFFLADALRDDWSMDRFVTALVAMEGSTRNGGSASFAIATQNDLPMANKAQILSSAFLAMEMKCARCHDAPNHPFNQEDLFAVSAMLQREPVKVPASSLTKGLNTNSHVTVSLTPGQQIDAHFPFASLKTDPLPGVLRNPDDTREQLAAIMTDPRNERFAQVLVNRLWKRLLGFGIVDPVDDWENVSPSHPELLTWLGRELITHDYDLKHVARLILNSAAYQRAVTDGGSRVVRSSERLFASPARRRLSAEQLVDSLFEIAGKDFDCEELNFDLDARRTTKDFLNMGFPQRAWEFVGLSNERDRPSLGKPSAQPFTDVLTNFGWRDSRAEPKSVREEAPNVLQPALLANGILGERITRVSDDSAFATLALRDQPLDDLITQIFQRVLTRAPSAKERAAFAGELRDGYEERVRVVSSSDLPKKPRVTKFAMWSNHLHPDSTPVVYERERLVRAGDPPTPRLAAPWRERLEDAIWALMMTPEFTYLP